MDERLNVPGKRIDAILDTDAFNEVDDQFAIAYLLNLSDKVNLRAIYAAPFFNEKSSSPADGMNKSYDEILNIIKLAGKDGYADKVFRGSNAYLPDENTPVESDACSDFIKKASGYTKDNPLYVVCIGAITNVASALIKAPQIANNIVIVWLGGHDVRRGYGCDEFNMKQDIAAARVVFKSAAALVQVACNGVASDFNITGVEFDYWLGNKNKVCDYLVGIVRETAKKFADRPWGRILWDVTAVAWLVNDNNRFMESALMKCPMPGYDLKYHDEADAKTIRYITSIYRDDLFYDLIKKLSLY